jgi:hypothetical protein
MKLPLAADFSYYNRSERVKNFLHEQSEFFTNFQCEQRRRYIIPFFHGRDGLPNKKTLLEGTNLL